MKKVLVTFSAMAIIFVWGKSEAVVVDKAMHKGEMHKALEGAQKIKEHPKATKEMRDHAMGLKGESKERIDVHMQRMDDMMSTKRNEYYKGKVKKSKKMMPKKGMAKKVKK
ncbi:MAG: hypothetical protein Q8K37_02870 [Alphaproteobacteria bacterium]|nr:hypothetical protein [Alphaproteobacteria bacterium]